MSVFVDCIIIMQKTISPESLKTPRNDFDAELEHWQFTGLAKEGLMVNKSRAPFTSAINLLNSCPDLFEHSFENMLQTLQSVLDSVLIQNLEVKNKPLAFVIEENSEAISKILKERTSTDDLLVLNLYTRLYSYRIKLFHLSDQMVRSSKMGPKSRPRCVRLLQHQNLLFLLEKQDNNFSFDQNNFLNKIDAKHFLSDHTKSTLEESMASNGRFVTINQTANRSLDDKHGNSLNLSYKTKGQNSLALPSDKKGSNSVDQPLLSVMNSHRSAPINGHERKLNGPSQTTGKLVFYSLSKNFGGLSTDAKEIVFVSRAELLKAGIDVDDSDFAHKLTKEDIIVICRKQTWVERGNQYLIGFDLKLATLSNDNKKF